MAKYKKGDVLVRIVSGHLEAIMIKKVFKRIWLGFEYQCENLNSPFDKGIKPYYFHSSDAALDRGNFQKITMFFLGTKKNDSHINTVECDLGKFLKKHF